MTKSKQHKRPSAAPAQPRASRGSRRRITSSSYPVYEPPAPSQWLQEMQTHFQQHGFYRAKDLYRLLGHPGQSFEGRERDVLPLASRAPKGQAR